jgi:hypothetical protein
MTVVNVTHMRWMEKSYLFVDRQCLVQQWAPFFGAVGLEKVDVNVMVLSNSVRLPPLEKKSNTHLEP